MHPLRILAALLLAISYAPSRASAAEFNARDFGAIGDGKKLDTKSINQAIEAAAAAGGGTVRLPAGTYLSFSIRLKSHIELRLDPGCTLVAAAPDADGGSYDPPEVNEPGKKQYQDFGHSYFHNSLIWGENLVDVSITGPGRIYGKGLVRGGRRPGARGPNGTADSALLPGASASSSLPPTTAPNAVDPTTAVFDATTTFPPPGFQTPPQGSGNKAIGLKNCQNVILRDFSILQAGWFGLLAAGVDNLTIDNVKVDTNRDGFDIDCCRNARIVNCTVNAPNDDAIVLKSTYVLGELRASENITISGCQVSGYDVGSLLDGTFKKTQERAPDRDGPTGRIKFGTESNGGFKNIAISNCVFDRSRGLAIESVDGAIIEDITITNLVMRDVSSSPIFIRLGNRARGPEGTPIGAIRRVTISHVIASNADPRYPVLIAGLRDHPIEDLRLADISVFYRGGLTLEQVAQQPADLLNTFFLRGPGLSGPRQPFSPPEQEKGYPEPSMFGLLPAYGIYVRHAKNVFFRDIELSFAKEDTRPAVVIDDVAGIAFEHLKAQRASGAAFFVLRETTNFSVHNSPTIADTRRELAKEESLE